MTKRKGYILSQRAAQRVVDAVRKVEPLLLPTKQGAGDPTNQVMGRVTALVRITSLTVTNNKYPGKRVEYNAADDTFEDVEDILVRPANGETLALGVRYDGVEKGDYAGDETVYVVVPPGGAVEGVVRLTSTSLSGPFYPGKLVGYDPSTDTFSDVEDVWVRELNANTLTTSVRYLGEGEGEATEGGDTRPVYAVEHGLQGRSLSGAAPSNNDVLTWVAADSAWEPKPGGGSSSLQVDDPSTTVTSVTRITADGAGGGSTTGLIVSPIGTGHAGLSIASASATQRGVVTTGTQTFAGGKTFTGLIHTQSTLEVDSTSQLHGDVTVGPDLFGGGGSASFAITNAVHPSGPSSGYGVSEIRATLTDPGGTPTRSLALTFEGNYNGTGQPGLLLDLGAGGGAGYLVIVGGVNGSGVGLQYTDPLGNQFSSGILTGFTDWTGIAYGWVKWDGAGPSFTTFNGLSGVGTYTVGKRLTPGGTDGQITIADGLITAITEAT